MKNNPFRIMSVSMNQVRSWCGMVPPFCALLLVGAVVVAPAWRVQASDSWPQIKITTLNSGLHHVMAADLAALIGVSSNDVQARILQGNWQLLNQGQPVGWLAGSNGVDLIFHAQALRNNYTTNNVYWLVDGTNAAPAFVNGGSPAAASAKWYLAATNCEQDIYCRYELGTNPDSNYWYWANLVTGHPLRGKFSVTVPLDALGSTSALAQITVRVCGASTTTTVTNSVGLSVNGTTNAAWVGTWQGAVPAVFTFNFPASLLNVGNNTIQFTALGTPLTQWWLDGFVLQFPRPYAAVAGALQCGANSNAVVTMTGFNNNLITVLDVSQPLSPVVVTNLLVETNGGQWRASFVPASGNASYSVAQSGSLLTPLALEAVTPLNLASPTNRAACVIIAPPALQNSAAALADYRNAQGLVTRVIPLEAIYNEFNGGLCEPQALCQFLAQAHSTWQLPPAYVVLAGNGTYDYRNLLGMNDNLIPPLMIMTLYGLTASDSEFGDLGGTNAPEIAVGRLPATNSVQLAAVISKIKAYEALPSPAAKQALLVADFNDPSAGDFPDEILAVQGIVTPAFQTTTVLPSTTTQMNGQVLASLNAGEDLMCYLGHGASTSLGTGTPGYLSISDLGALNNGTRLPFIVSVCCLAGSFATPGSVCFSQAFVTATNSGAIAVLSASTFSLNYDGVNLNTSLMTSLADGSTGRLGDFVRGALADYNQTPRFTPWGMFNLMGDPALQLFSTPRSSITGSVKLDMDGDGVADSKDTSLIVPVEVKIYTNGTTLVATVTDNSDGSFSVSNLPPGNYTVVQMVPSGYTNTTPVTVNVTLISGSTNTANYLDMPTFSIGNRVFADNGAGGGTANNGIQDGAEPGIANVLMKLYAADGSGNPTGSVLATTNTDANGYYRFDGLFAGTYVVVVDVIGSAAALNGMITSTGWTTNLTLAGDLHDHGKDAVMGGSSVLPDGIASVPVQVGIGLQPTNEAVSGSGAGANGPGGDAGDNLAVDFGFYSPSPTAAVLAWLGAYVNTNGQVWVTWQTLSEDKLLYFDVLRSAPSSDEATDVTPGLVFSDSFGGDDLGYLYQVPDPTVVLPGKYTYCLVGWNSDFTTNVLAKVTVTLAKEASLNVIRITGLQAQTNGMLVEWVGGQPPYTLETQTSPGAKWIPVGSAQPGETEAVVPATNPSGFFRVKGGGDE
jgi:hypothetical protein